MRNFDVGKQVRSLGAFTILLAALLVSACDSGDGTGDPRGANPGQAEPNPTLFVKLEPATAGLLQLANLRVTAYNVRGAKLAEETVAKGQDVSFEDLPAGSVQIRVVGLDNRDGVLGFSDVSAAIPTDTKVEALLLSPGAAVPQPATPGSPFLAFTGLPGVYQAEVAYLVEVSAFDAQGELDPEASASISLSSSGVSADKPTLRIPLAHGRARFRSIVFPGGSNGTVTFTATAIGFGAAVSPTLPVRGN